MLVYSDEDNVGENKQLKQKLLEHYNWPHNVEGHEDIGCFRNVAECIINEKLQSFKNSIEDKAEWVVRSKNWAWNFRKKIMTANLIHLIEVVYLLLTAIWGFFHSYTNFR